MGSEEVKAVGLVVVLVMLLLVLVVGAAAYLFTLATVALRDPLTKRRSKKERTATR